MVELFEKWRNYPPPLRRPILAIHFGVWQTNLAFPHVGGRQIWAPFGGGGGGWGRVAWVALSRAFPQTQGISFLSRSP
jgi:hypothetical protein